MNFELAIAPLGGGAVGTLAATPWDEARDLDLIREDPLRGSKVRLDPGVNYFVLALERLGCRTFFSCEGHPQGFYITFTGSYHIALMIRSLASFTVEIEKAGVWILRLGDVRTELEKVQQLRWASQLWEERIQQVEANPSDPSILGPSPCLECRRLRQVKDLELHT